MNELTPRILTASERSTLIDANVPSKFERIILRQFNSEVVYPVRIGNVDVIIVAEETNLPLRYVTTGLRSYIRSPRTKQFVMEYFPPELEKNAKDTPLIGSILHHQLTEQKAKWRSLEGSRAQADLAKEQGIPVSVLDIANKPAYMMNYWLQIGAPYIAAMTLTQLAGICRRSWRIGCPRTRWAS